MSAKLKLRIALLGSIFAATLPATPSAFAISAEVAKNCSALAEKAFPLRVPGNPAAGYANGTGADYRKYFNQCVANGGKAGDQAPKQDNAQGASTSGQGGNTGAHAPK